MNKSANSNFNLDHTRESAFSYRTDPAVTTSERSSSDSSIQNSRMQDNSAPQYGQNQKSFILSRDEMNLSEFPLTVLSTRASSNIKTLEFSDKIRNKNGEMINRNWIITGADKFGLPTSSDDEVLLGLLKLTVDQQFDSRKVSFSRYELLKNLRWSTEGRNYSRLQKALDRLSGVRIKATNAFFDNDLKSHSTKNFGIIDGYELNDGRDNDRPSFFLWSEVIFKSFQSGFIKKLDLDFYLNLKSAVSKRIYRYLDKHFWYKSRVQVNFFTFAHEKVGVSRTYQYVSSIRQQIDPALDELKSCGFIKDYSYQGQGSATEIIIFAASGQPRVSASKTPEYKSSSDNNSAEQNLTEPHSAKLRIAEDQSNQNKIREHRQSQNIAPHNQDLYNPLKAEILFQLQERGISLAQAEKLLFALDETSVLEKTLKIIRHYDYLLSSGSKLISRNPVGFLFKAIQSPERFILPEEQQKNIAKANATRQQDLPVQNVKNTKQPEILKIKYLAFRKQEILKFKEDCEPELLNRLYSEVEKALVKLKNLISESNFKDAIEHGVQEKLAKLFALPEYEEWSRTNR